jgi:hypothetical protein
MPSDSRFPAATDSFVERLAVVGRLSKDGRETPPLDCLIDVSHLGTSGVQGYVIGNSATIEDIDRVVGTGGPVRLTASDGSETITSDVVWINGTTRYGGRDELPHGLTGVACRFSCTGLRRELHFSSAPDREFPREMRFLLRGPSDVWPAYWSDTVSYTGAASIRLRGQHIHIGGRMRFSVSVVPHFLYDTEQESAGGRSHRVRTTSMALVCQTKVSQDAYSDESFAAEATSVAEDMLLLASLMARELIVWHSVLQSSHGRSVQKWRSLSPGRSRQENRQSIVDRMDQRRFLTTGLQRLRRNRAAGVDLTVPLLYAIASASGTTATQRFGQLFLALEALRTMYVDQHGKGLLVAKAKFEHVAADLQRTLATSLRRRGIRSSNVALRFRENLAGINRRSLWDGLASLLKHLRIDWDDLYPEPTPKRPTFLKLRNRMFHAGYRPEDEELVKETLRLESVVHRILLRWLGSENLWNVPDPALRRFLSGRSLPRRHRLAGRERKRTQLKG